MPCFSPLTGWRSRKRNPSGKYSITFIKSEGFGDLQLSVPCGSCSGCRLEHSRRWAVRCMHEAQMHAASSFITLTYRDADIPTLGGHPTLHKPDLQKFMKRLRRMFGDGIKFYACGEYGELQHRPHYHLCVFGVDFKDKVLWQERDGHRLFISKELDQLWPYGFATIGTVTFETAAYTARYCMKKRKGKNWQEYYERVIESTGEIVMIQPEFALMSRRPGLGKSWVEKFGKEVISNDSVVVNGKEMKPPKYYDSIFEKDIPEKHSVIKAKRRAAAKKCELNNTLARLFVRGKCKEAQIKQLKRSIE